LPLLHQPAPSDPRCRDHDDRVYQRRLTGRGGGSSEHLRRGGAWDHEMFISSLRESSPERAVPDGYVPPKEGWVSRAGGVYIKTQDPLA
jgi:hypothetical protein